MMSTKTTIGDILSGVLRVVFSGYVFFVIIWGAFFIGGAYLYFTIDFDEEEIIQYRYLDSYYSFDDNGEKEYNFNVMDIREENIKDQRRSIEVTQVEFNEQCDEEYYCKGEGTWIQGFFVFFIVLGCILIVICEMFYIEGADYWSYDV
jgi:hypothetical protein